MNGRVSHVDVAVCFSHTGEIATWRVRLKEAQIRRLEGALGHLLNLGHVAAFSVRLGEETSWAEILHQLRSRCGDLIVGACLDPPGVHKVQPASLMIPVSSFDHEINGLPTATGQLLGLDLELIATPSPDEELGAYLPGRNGLWLIHARPLLA